MSLFEEVVGQRFLLGTPSTVATPSLRGQAFMLVAVSSGPEVVAAAATREFAPLVLLDTFKRTAGKCLVPFERKYSNIAVRGIAEAVVRELLRARPPNRHHGA